MNTSLQHVNHFYDITLKGADGLEQLSNLLTEDVIFRGPVQQADGREAVTQINATFVPMLTGYNRIAAFENEDMVSVFHTIMAQLPNGEDASMTTAELIKLRDGLIAEHHVFFDPRSFIDQMAQMQG